MVRWACLAPALPTMGSAGSVHPPDRHCEQKTAGHEQTHYLFSHNLWAAGARREPPHPVPLCSELSLPPLSHTCLLSISLCPLPLPSVPVWLSLPLSWPIPGPAAPTAQRKPLPRSALAWPPCGYCDSQTGLLSPSLCPLSHRLSLFDLRGSFLEFIVFYCTWWDVLGAVGRRACPRGVCQYLQKLLPKSCLAACGALPSTPSGTGDLDRCYLSALA